jgi:hypothetical protein
MPIIIDDTKDIEADSVGAIDVAGGNLKAWGWGWDSAQRHMGALASKLEGYTVSPGKEKINREDMGCLFIQMHQ